MNSDWQLWLAALLAGAVVTAICVVRARWWRCRQWRRSWSELAARNGYSFGEVSPQEDALGHCPVDCEVCRARSAQVATLREALFHANLRAANAEAVLRHQFATRGHEWAARPASEKGQA